MVWAVCLESMVQLSGGCREAVSRVLGDCLDGVGGCVEAWDQFLSNVGDSGS